MRKQQKKNVPKKNYVMCTRECTVFFPNLKDAKECWNNMTKAQQKKCKMFEVID